MKILLTFAALAILAAWVWLTIDWYWCHPEMTKPEFFWFRAWWYVGTFAASFVIVPAMKHYE